DTRDLPLDSLTYAYHTFLWYNRYDELHLRWVRQANFTHIKQIFAWEDIQPGQDLWNWQRADEVVSLAENAGVRIIARLSDAPDWSHPTAGVKDEDWHDAPPTDIDDFGVFCGEIAARYAGRIDAYQVWNEPNLSREWGAQAPDAAGYVELLGVCSDAIRLADPNVVIISAGLSPTGNMDALAMRDDIYLQQMYDTGFSQYVDVVGVHAPGFSPVDYTFEDAANEQPDPRGRWFVWRRPEDLRKIMVRNGDAEKQMAILEMGWTVAPPELETYAWFAVSEQEQAEQLVAAHEYIAEHWRPWVGLVTTIYISDPAWDDNDEEQWFAVTLSNNWTRPAFGALGNMPKYCMGGIIPPRDPGSPEALGLEQSLPCR
ncbi:MAG: cellulase family glycosylhydrolase, partial [Chloroflexota bacterium]